MSPALLQAINYLRSLQPSQNTEIKQIPSITDLAENAGVSRVTMVKAIAQLKAKGMCVTIRGKGTFIRAREDEYPVEQPDTQPRDTWQRIKDSLSRDILNGVYAHGTPIPSYKQLCGRYDISYITMKKALTALARDGIIEPCGRSYSVVSPGTHVRSARIVLVGAQADNGHIARGLMGGEYMRFLEGECIKSHIALEGVCYRRVEAGLEFFEDGTAKQTSLYDSQSVLGYLVIAGALQQVDSIAVIKRLARFKKPVAVFVQRLIPGLYEAVRNLSSVKLYPVMYDTRPGQAAARYLLSRGHRRIAYISHLHAQAWSPQRYRGLGEMFDAAGFADAVTSFTQDNLGTAFDYQALAAQSFNLTYIRQACRRWKSRLSGRAPQTMDTLLRYAIDWGSGFDEMRYHMQPLFEQALAEKEITAWVAANDILAVIALDYLAGRAIDVPCKISVVGFDDSPDALERGLTSYNPNIPAVILSMLRHATGIAAMPGVEKAKAVRIDGFVNERRTVAAL